MKLALRTAFAALAFCFAGCASTGSNLVANHGPTREHQPTVIAMSGGARVAGAYEPSAAEERAMAANGRAADRGIPMPEPARESIHALPTPQVPIPSTPAERGMPAMASPRGGNAAYWQ